MSHIPGVDPERYEADRREAEQVWADQWLSAYDECIRLGILDTSDDQRSITLADMQGWLGL